MIEKEKGDEIQKWILADGNCPSCINITTEEIRKSIIKLYYHAKNKIYLQNNYYDEMKKIQTRTDFARSIAVISIIYFILTVLLSFILIIDRLFKDWITNKLRNDKINALMNVRPIKFSNSIGTGLILIIIFSFSWWAYDRESMEYNKRAFGYFATSLKKAGQ